MSNWVDLLNEKLAEMLSDRKRVKFTTHANRKSFIAKVKELVKTNVEASSNPKQDILPSNKHDDIIVHPMGAKEPRGAVVMDQAGSVKGDEQSAITRAAQKARGQHW